MSKEIPIQNDIVRVVGGLPGLRIWRQNTGVAKFGNRKVRFGIPGQADITGILPDGRRLEIEVKSATGRQSEEQKKFQAMIERFGGLYILAYSPEDVMTALWRAGYIDG